LQRRNLGKIGPNDPCRHNSKHYNYFRDYDAATGRYLQSDPIGLQGGANTFGYASSAPLRWIDPSGLVQWNGNSFSMGGGAGILEYYDLVSECKCGRQVRARVKAMGLGPGRGYTWAGSSSASLQDGAECPDSGNLEGLYSKSGVGFAGGIGFSYNTVLLGSAGSSSLDFQIGLDFSGGAARGSSAVVWSFATPCGCGR
jgi:RHS repeat-associated protein